MVYSFGKEDSKYRVYGLPPQITLLSNLAPSAIWSDAAYEFGIRLSSTQPGFIRAIRFFKVSGDSVTHTGRIWSNSGTLLTSVVFANETSSGWQQQELTFPILANTNYIISVNSGTPYPSITSGFSQAITNGSLSAGVGAGLFNATPGSFPNQTFNNNNYLRDILFEVS